jgi:hypothetical protein
MKMIISTENDNFSLTILLPVSTLLLFLIQVSLVIRGRYVPLFWTANTEFADKKTHFD